MKLRPMGPPDIVRGWASLLEEAFQSTGREYPTRGGGADIRYYLDVDDRRAEEAVRLQSTLALNPSDQEADR